jgi:hypothetical protein
MRVGRWRPRRRRLAALVRRSARVSGPTVRGSAAAARGLGLARTLPGNDGRVPSTRVARMTRIGCRRGKRQRASRCRAARSGRWRPRSPDPQPACLSGVGGGVGLLQVELPDEPAVAAHAPCLPAGVEVEGANRSRGGEDGQRRVVAEPDHSDASRDGGVGRVTQPPRTTSRVGLTSNGAENDRPGSSSGSGVLAGLRDQTPVPDGHGCPGRTATVQDSRQLSPKPRVARAVSAGRGRPAGGGGSRGVQSRSSREAVPAPRPPVRRSRRHHVAGADDRGCGVVHPDGGDG